MKLRTNKILLITFLLLLPILIICLFLSLRNAQLYGPWNEPISLFNQPVRLNRNNENPQEKLFARGIISHHTIYGIQGDFGDLFLGYGAPKDELYLHGKITNYKMVLKCDVSYYLKKNGRYIFEFKIPKGTEIYALHPEFPDDFGYGFLSYPTIDKNWRYARPFITVEEHENSKDIKGYRYVKLGDLKDIAFEAYDSNPVFEEIAQTVGYSKSWFKHAGMLLYVDEYFYKNRDVYPGYHFPDLNNCLFNTPITIIFIVELAILAIILTKRFQERKN